MIGRKQYTGFTLFILLCVGCTNHMETEVIDCETEGPAITLDTKTDPTDCDSGDGSIAVTGAGGKMPYQFSINGGEFQSSGTFTGLSGGTFTVKILDANKCESQLEASLAIQSSDLAATYEATTDTECVSNNGSITVNATGSNSPFQFSINSGSFGTTNTFTGLENGTYSLIVKDAEGCSVSLSATVARGETGISWDNEVKSIIAANCAISGCHVSGSQSPNLSNLASIQNNAGKIKTRTGNRSMPPTGRPELSQDQILKIACWVDDGAKNN